MNERNHPLKQTETEAHGKSDREVGNPQLLIPQIIFEQEKKDTATSDPTAMIREYTNLLLHRKWFILACLVLFATLGIFQIKRSTPYYTASAIVRYQPDPGKDAMVFDQSRGTPTSQKSEEINTLIRLINSPTLASAINDRIGDELRRSRAADEKGETTPVGQLTQGISNLRDSFVRSLLRVEKVDLTNEANLKQARIGGLMKVISANKVKETNLIEITVRHANKVMAARIANEAVEQLIKIVAEQKREGLGQASMYLRQELAEARVKLAEAEAELREKSGNTDTLMLTESRQIAINTLVSLESRLDEQRLTVELLAAENAEQSDASRHFFLASSDKSYQSLIEKRNAIYLESLQGAFVEGSSIRLQQQNALESIDKLMGEARQTLALARETDLAVAREKLEALSKRRAEQQTTVDAIEAKMADFRVVEREVESAQGVYSTLLDRLKQVQMMQNLDSSSIVTFKEATVPNFPSEPNVAMTLFLFVFMGGALAMGSILIAHMLDRTVKSPSALESRFSVATLATIPKIQTTGANKRVGVLPRNSQAVEAEQFRSLRASLLYAQAGRAPKVILVTSCLPGEGKSTISTNIAAIFAERGNRTLLIDTDLKRSMIHQVFGIPRIPGLSDLLTGQKQLEEVAVSTEYENLSVIPAGATTPAPTTLLESKAMAALIERLRSEYDTVIIDSPPALGLADPYVLTKLVDGVALVVRHGSTPIDGLNRVLAKLRSMDTHVLGVVYNFMSRADQHAYSYGYNYGPDAKTTQVAAKEANT